MSVLTWWLSFAGEGKFNGLVLLEAASTDETLADAVARVNALGLNPGGQVMGLTVTPEMEPSIELLPRNVLIDEETVRGLGHRRIHEMEERGLTPIDGTYDILCEHHSGDTK